MRCRGAEGWGRLGESVRKGRAAAGAEEPVGSCAKAAALTQKEADGSLLQQGQHTEASTTLSFARHQVSGLNPESPSFLL